MPFTAPTISEANSTFSIGTTSSSRSIPGWWYTHVSNQTLAIISSSVCQPAPAFSSAIPLKRPQWYGHGAAHRAG